MTDACPHPSFINQVGNRLLANREADEGGAGAAFSGVVQDRMPARGSVRGSAAPSREA